MADQVPHPVKRERMARLVELVQRRARERAQRFVGRTMEVLVEGPSRTDPARLRGRTGHNKTVNFDGMAEPASWSRSRSPTRRRPLCPGTSCCEPGRRSAGVAVEVLAIFGPTGVGKTAVAVAVADCCAPGRGRGRGLVRCDPGLPGARDARRDGDSRGALAARAPAGRLRRGEWRVQRRPVRDPCARGDRPAPRRGTAARSWSGERGSTCVPRSPTSSCDRRSRPRYAARSRPRSPPEARRRSTASSIRTSPRRSIPKTASGWVARSSSSARASTRREGARSCGPHGFVAPPFSSA